jgi:hypothetical protein
VIHTAVTIFNEDNLFYNSLDSSGLGQRSVAGSYEYGNAALGSIKHISYSAEQLLTSQGLLHEISLFML